MIPDPRPVQHQVHRAGPDRDGRGGRQFHGLRSVRRHADNLRRRQACAVPAGRENSRSDVSDAHRKSLFASATCQCDGGSARGGLVRNYEIHVKRGNIEQQRNPCDACAIRHRDCVAALRPGRIGATRLPGYGLLDWSQRLWPTLRERGSADLRTPGYWNSHRNCIRPNSAR